MEAVNPTWHPTGSVQSPFNTPLECGLRLALILAEAFPAECDLQRLTNYDYLLVHSGDVKDGPPSIHPATPHRSAELHVRRQMIEMGLQMMMTRSVIECRPSSSGFVYLAGAWALTFLNSLQAPYTKDLKDSAAWVVWRFGGLSDAELSDFISKHWERWGPEFTETTLSLLTE